MLGLRVIFDPVSTFERIKNQGILETIFNYVFGIFLMVSLMAITIVSLKLFYFQQMLYYLMFLMFSTLIIGNSLILSFVVYFITEKYSFEKAFKVTVYASYPVFVCAFLFLINFRLSLILLPLLAVWTLVLHIIGLSKVYEVDKNTAAICTLIFYQVFLMTLIPAFTL